jgi:hypothetical protein
MIVRLLAILVGALLILYAADYIVLKFRHPQLGSVQTRTSYAVTQKNKKTEYYFNPPENETCTHSLLPQLGYNPCWYVERHRDKSIRM